MDDDILYPPTSHPNHKLRRTYPSLQYHVHTKEGGKIPLQYAEPWSNQYKCFILSSNHQHKLNQNRNLISDRMWIVGRKSHPLDRTDYGLFPSNATSERHHPSSTP